jgi:Zn-dependent protease with chaperone function
MCWICDAKNPAALTAPSSHSPWAPRRAFLRAAGAVATAAATAPVLAQVDVGGASALRKLVPAETLERSATRQYAQVLAEAKAKGALAPDNHPQLKRLRAMAAKLIPYTRQWNPRVSGWQWEVNLIGSQQINAWCMPGGKIAFYTGILDKLKLTDDEAAMIMGHEMAHALREHARERLAKSQATDMGLRLGAQLLGLGQVGDLAAGLGGQLLTLKYSRDDETEADLVGLEIAARGAYQPEASVQLWKKMVAANGGSGGPGFLSTHPAGPERIRQLEANLPKVQGLYQQALRG